MSTAGHLWAIGYDDMERADKVREEISKLAWDRHHYLHLEDIAVVVRQLDGSFTLDRKPFPGVANILGCSAVGLLAGLVVGAPMTGAAFGALLGSAGSGAALAGVKVGDDFVKEVHGLMKPGTSAVFVLDDEGDMEMILRGIQGLGGTVLKTNVDAERARLIQSTLADSSGESAGK
jgi:uncharacterized membrane protein